MLNRQLDELLGRSTMVADLLLSLMLVSTMFVSTKFRQVNLQRLKTIPIILHPSSGVPAMRSGKATFIDYTTDSWFYFKG
jgi:hypothetical protein